MWMDGTWMDDQFLISCEQRAVWASYFGRESQLVKWIIIITFGAQISVLWLQFRYAAGVGTDIHHPMDAING
jgi:hypothetical protein